PGPPTGFSWTGKPGQERANRLPGIRGFGDRSNHHDAPGPVLDHVGEGPGVDAPDGEPRPPLPSGGRSNQVETHGRTPRLGRRAVYGTDAHVVGAGRSGLQLL